jgi:hypothetical protein
MKNNFKDAKVGDLIIDGVSNNRRFLLILRIDNFPHENYDSYYDLNCIVYVEPINDVNRCNVAHFHFKNDDEDVEIIKI